MNSPSDFESEYRSMTDDQLLQLASEGGLVDEAKIALQAEMSRRKLTNNMVDSFRAEQTHYEDSRIWSDSNINVSFRLGIGFNVFGRAYLSEEDRSRDIQVRTKWFVFFYLPIFPVASFRYLYKDSTIGMIQWKEQKLIDQVPLNWRQIRKTWTKAFGFIAFVVALFFLCLAWVDKSHK